MNGYLGHFFCSLFPYYLASSRIFYLSSFMDSPLSLFIPYVRTLTHTICTKHTQQVVQQSIIICISMSTNEKNEIKFLLVNTRKAKSNKF